MKQILFPTAYTAHSRVAYRYAQKLAQYFNASITLVHIYEPPAQIPLIEPDSEFIFETGDMELQLNEQHWEEQINKLKAFAQEMNAKQFQDISLDFIVTDGIVVNELLAILEQQNYDLVVMGTRRHKRIGRLFGNTTFQLIDEVNCPLLLIPPEVQFMHIDKIVYGNAVEFSSRKAIDHLLDWCLAFDASLQMLHLYQDQNKEQATEKMQTLKAEFEQENKLGLMTFQMVQGKNKDLLDWYASFTGAILLAIHWRRLGILQELIQGNLTKTLAEKTQVPLLVLKS